MLVLLQRVLHASCKVDEKIIGQIGPGLLAFCGFEKDDNDAYTKKEIELSIINNKTRSRNAKNEDKI